MEDIKKMLIKYVRRCKEAVEAIRRCEKTVGGVEGYAVKTEVFYEISQDLHLMSRKIVYPDITQDDLRKSLFLLMAWSGRWYSVYDNPRSVHFIEIEGELYLYFKKGIFKYSYGDTDLERVFTSLALWGQEYPLSDHIRDSAEFYDIELREDYISKVDEVSLEQFNGCTEIPKISSSLLPECLQGEGLKVLSIGLTDCSPCKLVDKAFEALEEELDDVQFFSRMMGEDQDISGMIEEFGVFAAPTLCFSDGKKMVVHTGGTGDLETQKKYIRSVVRAIDEVRYDPFIRRGELIYDLGIARFWVKVIE